MTRSSVEGDVMDLQFSSLDWNKRGPLSSFDSCDVSGVPTVVNANVDQFSPVESFKQQQTEEDALSTTSTIDYSYPEEEYLSEGEADDEEDLTPTEENKDEAPSGLSLEVSEWFDWWDMSDQRLERFISSCKVSDAGRLEASTWIHVYAYFNDKKLYGGYGVVVRNALREPIIASAKFSKAGISFYYQVFKGILAGVALAEEHGCSLSHLRVRSNSLALPTFYSHLHFCSSEECKATDDEARICKSCDNFIMSQTTDCDMRLVKPLAVKLRSKKPEDFHTRSGLAEHYLAKLEKKKILVDGFATDEDGSGETGRVIRPADVPRRLKHILWGEGLVMSGRRMDSIV